MGVAPIHVLGNQGAINCFTEKGCLFVGSGGTRIFGGQGGQGGNQFFQLVIVGTESFSLCEKGPGPEFFRKIDDQQSQRDGPQQAVMDSQPLIGFPLGDN